MIVAMRVSISQTTFGYHVALSAEPDRFAQLLETFKSIIPKACRRFITDRRAWFVDLRAGKRVERFVSAVTEAGGKVER